MPTPPAQWARVCPHCGTGPSAFVPRQLFETLDHNSQSRRWIPASCQVCGGAIVAELDVHDYILRTYPEASAEWDVAHLPSAVKTDWEEASSVYRVRAYRAAVVMCGRTLEAAANALKIEGTALAQRITNMLNAGLITTQFKEAMSYVRVIRNTGAHAGATVSQESAEGTMRFTLQALRLLFEVPGELHRLRTEPPEAQDNINTT